MLSTHKVNYLKMIIIKYYEWLKFLKHPDRMPVWEICTKEYKAIKQISRDEAKRLIKNNNLKLVFHNNDGAIYE